MQRKTFVTNQHKTSRNFEGESTQQLMDKLHHEILKGQKLKCERVFTPPLAWFHLEFRNCIYLVQKPICRDY